MMLFSVDEKQNNALFSEIDKIGDIVSYDNYLRIWVYRLNPAKVSFYGIKNAIDFLTNKLNVSIQPNILKLLNDVSSEPFDLFIDLKDGFLHLYPANNKILDSLINEGIVDYDIYFKNFIAKVKDLHTILDYFTVRGLKVKLGFKLDYKASFKSNLQVNLREYHEEAYREWRKAGYRGVVVMPDGASRMVVALKAIDDLKVKTLILAPTLESLNKWFKYLVNHLGISQNFVEIFDPRKRKVRDITLMTYDDASSSLWKIPTFFGLVIADECHYAVSDLYRIALNSISAPYRLGLTSTPYRDDGLHKYYSKVLGPIVYHLTLHELRSMDYLNKPKGFRIPVGLSREEFEEYRRLMRIYLSYCNKAFPGINNAKERFRKVLELCPMNQEAREALRARLKANRIAWNAERKIKVVENLLKKFENEKILIFSRNVDIIKRISRSFLVPKILQDTPEDEKRVYLNMFKREDVRVLATSILFSKGVEYPEPSIAIIVSRIFSCSKCIQRIMELLKPKNRQSLIIEIVTDINKIENDVKDKKVDDLKKGALNGF